MSQFVIVAPILITLPRFVISLSQFVTRRTEMFKNLKWFLKTFLKNLCSCKTSSKVNYWMVFIVITNWGSCCKSVLNILQGYVLLSLFFIIYIICDLHVVIKHHIKFTILLLVLIYSLLVVAQKTKQVWAIL